MLTASKVRKAFKTLAFNNREQATEENDPDLHKHETEGWGWHSIKYGRKAFTFVDFNRYTRSHGGSEIHSVFARDQLHAYQQLLAFVEGRPVNIYNFDRED